MIFSVARIIPSGVEKNSENNWPAPASSMPCPLPNVDIQFDYVTKIFASAIAKSPQVNCIDTCLLISSINTETFVDRNYRPQQVRSYFGVGRT